jgi:tetratricopeptide (TPR) repeat protein
MLLQRGDLLRARALAQEALDIHRMLEEDMDIVCALYTLADIEIGLGYDDQSRAHLRECVAMSRVLKKERYIGWGLFVLGRLAVQHKDFDEAQRSFDECLAVYPKDDERDLVALYHELGLMACLRGEYDMAVAMHTKSLNLWRSARAYGLVCMALFGLGDVALFRGDLANARSIFEEGLTLSLEDGSRVRMMLGLAGLAAVYAAEGLHRHALTLWEATEVAHASLAQPRRPLRHDAYLNLIEMARERLGSSAANSAAVLGRTMALEPAVHHALNLSAPARLVARH